MMTRALIAIGAVLVFGTVDWQIAGKERLRSGGQTVYLDLEPRDPRSLMQGDYMALNFALAREIAPRVNASVDGPGVAVLKLNDKRVGAFSRLDDGAPLSPEEVRFRFRIRRGTVWLGTNAFFFHEGDEVRYRPTHFGEFRVNERGDAMLVDLRDQNLGKL
jgi:uncharacterized membrane-anchored protein